MKARWTSSRKSSTLSLDFPLKVVIFGCGIEREIFGNVEGFDDEGNEGVLGNDEISGNDEVSGRACGNEVDPIGCRRPALRYAIWT